MLFIKGIVVFFKEIMGYSPLTGTYKEVLKMLLLYVMKMIGSGFPPQTKNIDLVLQRFMHVSLYSLWSSPTKVTAKLSINMSLKDCACGVFLLPSPSHQEYQAWSCLRLSWGSQIRSM
ncbi:hypothetical protein DR999_PMT00372 [Platysternon megacephalum]|uniref:Uncharacterized protein n=1 Tax=Platysternon megacephalum TaxID=55544 RepID=A0A4D9EZ65_9SAUR|nr:hypothetical protein DR999_PMT00372 [Platysternon megacephalum]